MPPPQPQLTPVDVIRLFQSQVDRLLFTLLRDLLETKHLYQSVVLDAEAILKSLSANSEQSARDVQSQLYQWLARPWIIAHFDPSAAPPLNNPTNPSPQLVLHPIRIVCYQCKSRQAHVPVTWSNITAIATERRMVIRTTSKRPVQVFAFAYQCQACHAHPTTFLVARYGNRLREEGRSPIEIIELPTFVPTAQESHYRDAMIAHNSGKTLAALFYLRTFIEQFARRLVKEADRIAGADLMDRYGRTVPEDLRDRMPSLREWYDKLSEALHGAKEDAELFDLARVAIDKHFEIRKVFAIPDPTETEKPAGSGAASESP